MLHAIAAIIVPLMPTAPFQQAEELLGKDLRDFVAQRRNRVPRMSWDRIARDLWLETEQRVDVNGNTVRTWFERDGDAA